MATKRCSINIRTGNVPALTGYMGHVGAGVLDDIALAGAGSAFVALGPRHMAAPGEHDRSQRAAVFRAVQPAYDDDEPRIPFYELVRSEQRKELHATQGDNKRKSLS